jgi:hypothetical protein
LEKLLCFIGNCHFFREGIGYGLQLFDELFLKSAFPGCGAGQELIKNDSNCENITFMRIDIVNQ